MTITCGLSLLQNLLSFGEFVDHIMRKFPSIKIIDPKVLIRDHNFTNLIYRDCMVSGEISTIIMNILCRDPAKLCAELNSLIKFLKKVDNVSECRVFILSTDSPACKACSHLISKFIVEHLPNYVGRRFTIDISGIVSIPDISKGRYSDTLQKLAEGYVREAYRYIRNGYELYTIITGGFKMEIAYITVLSFILRSKIVYCPDPDSDIVILPPLPIDLDQDILRICERILAGDNVDDKSMELLRRYGLISQKNGRVMLERWVTRLIEARKCTINASGNI